MVARVQMEADVNAKPTRRRRRRLIPLFVSIPIALAVAWGAIWYFAYRMVEGYVMETTADSVVDSEIAVVCGDRALGGFPLRISIDCTDATAEGADGAEIAVKRFSATAPLYNPGWLEADAVGPLSYAGVNHLITADWSTAHGVVLAGFGGVSQGTVTFGDLILDVVDIVDDANWGATADAWTTELREAEGPDAMRVFLSTSNLMINIDGRIYPSLSGTATLTILESGGKLDRLPATMIGEWLATGGAFEVDHMALSSGRLTAEITGEGVLEVDGTLTGAITVRYSGAEDLPMFVSAVFPWLEDDSDIIADAIAALSQPIEIRGEPAYQVRLIIDHGAVKIGLIPIPLTIPSVGPLDHLLPDPT